MYLYEMDLTPYYKKLQLVQQHAAESCDHAIRNFYLKYMRLCVYFKADTRSQHARYVQDEMIKEHRGSLKSIRTALSFVEGVLTYNVELYPGPGSGVVNVTVYCPDMYLDNIVYRRELKNDIENAVMKSFPVTLGCKLDIQSYEQLQARNAMRMNTLTKASYGVRL